MAGNQDEGFIGRHPIIAGAACFLVGTLILDKIIDYAADAYADETLESLDKAGLKIVKK